MKTALAIIKGSVAYTIIKGSVAYTIIKGSVVYTIKGKLTKLSLKNGNKRSCHCIMLVMVACIEKKNTLNGLICNHI